MNILPFAIAALLLLPAIAAVLWAGWMMQLSEKDLRHEAELQHTDFDIGTWPVANRTTNA